MKTRTLARCQAGFTLIELLVGTVIGSIVSLGVVAFIDTGSMLAARNVSVNLTSNSIRGALDRTEHLIQQSNSDPVLMDTAGLPVAGNGPAAGVRFDLFKGGPVVVNPGTTTVASTVTTLTIRYAQATSLAPTAGDIIIIEGTETTLRPRIASTPAIAFSTPSVGMRDAVVPLTATLGTAVTATTALRARIVRDGALVVMPEGGNRQLRYYPDMAGTTSMSDASRFHVITDQIATATAADSTPFTLSTISGRRFVGLSLRVRANTFDRRLLGKQADEFNTFAQVKSFIRPKINP